MICYGGIIKDIVLKIVYQLLFYKINIKNIN